MKKRERPILNFFGAVVDLTTFFLFWYFCGLLFLATRVKKMKINTLCTIVDKWTINLVVVPPLVVKIGPAYSVGEKLLFYSKSPQEIDFVDCEQAENCFFSEKNKISMEKKREWLFETFLGLLLLFLDSNGCAYMLSMDEWIRMNDQQNRWSVVPPPPSPLVV